jgi:hypothetical protein
MRAEKCPVRFKLDDKNINCQAPSWWDLLNFSSIAKNGLLFAIFSGWRGNDDGFSLAYKDGRAEI